MLGNDPIKKLTFLKPFGCKRVSSWMKQIEDELRILSGEDWGQWRWAGGTITNILM
jgi:hypothetical protein